jgi:hypothetical protein
MEVAQYIISSMIIARPASLAEAIASTRVRVVPLRTTCSTYVTVVIGVKLARGFICRTVNFINQNHNIICNLKYFVCLASIIFNIKKCYQINPYLLHFHCQYKYYCDYLKRFVYLMNVRFLKLCEKFSM